MGYVSPERPVLEVRDLQTYFFTRWGVTKAVDGVSFQLHRGETLGIVGESGCGKSVTALSVVRLVPRPAGRIVEGQILLDGEDLLEMSPGQMRRIRGRHISMILQDPMVSLNPVFTVENQLVEAIKATVIDRLTQWSAKAVEMLRKVKIPAPEVRIKDYPHQLSGGMRQRVVGAIALCGPPDIIICDEPTTSLDVTIQAQYLNLLKDLQEETRVSIIFITHDFGIVASMCDRVLVMYAGKVVEEAEVGMLFDHPSHPYTKALMQSVPKLESDVDRLESIIGQPPRLHEIPAGCAFSPRCSYADSQCRHQYPPKVNVAPGHCACCWRLT